MPVTASVRTTTGAPLPGAPLDWLVTADVSGDMDRLQLLDLLGDGQALDPARPVTLSVLLGGSALFQDAVGPTVAHDAASGVTRIGLDISGALRAAGLAGTVPDGAVVQVTVPAQAGTAYSAAQPLLSRLIGQGDTLGDAAGFSGTQAGQAVTAAPAQGSAVLPTSGLAASVYAATPTQVTYRLRLAMPLGTAQDVQLSAISPDSPATLTWDDAAGVPAIGHAAFGSDSTVRPVPDLAAAGADGLTFSFGDVAAPAAEPAVLDVLYTTARPAAAPAVAATATEANSFGAVTSVQAASTPAAAGPDLQVQAGILDASGPQSHFEVVGGGSGSPVAYSTFTGQFSGPVTSALMDADPFSDRLWDVAAGDLVTFVMAVQNVAAGAPAWDTVLRDTPPPGLIVPADGADIHASDGAGDLLATTGNLFSPTDGLHLDPAAPLAGYDADSGLNVALVTFTLQATSAMPAPLATLTDTAAVVGVAARADGANLTAGAPSVAGTTQVVTMAPALAIALTGTSATTPNNQLAVGETATFHAAVSLPSGQSQALRLDAAVPAGLSLVSETVTYATPGTTGLYVGETSATGFNLGTLSAGGRVDVEFDIVAKATAAANGPVQVVVSAADPAGTGGRVSAAQGAPVVAVAPALSLQVVGPAQVQTGQVATYTVRLANAAGAAPAYGVRLTDALGAGLTATYGTAQASGPAAGASVGAVAGGGLEADTAELEPGETLVLTVQARAAGAVGTALQSQAQASAASLPGGTAANQLAPMLGAAATTVADTPPVLAGLPAAASTVDDAAIAPLAGLTLADPDVGQVESAQVVLSNATDGALTNLAGGQYDAAAGRYEVSGTAATVQAALAGLSFVPTPRQLAYGATRTTTLSVQVSDGVGGTATAATQIVAHGSNNPPSISGAIAGQSTTTTLAALPLAGLALADPDTGQVETLRVQATPGLGTLAGGLGTYDPASGIYTAQGTVPALQADARGLVFTPSAAGTAAFALTLDDEAGGVAQDASTTLSVQPTADTAGVAQHFMRLPGATFLAYAGGAGTTLEGEAYGGPVEYLRTQLIYDSADPAVIAAGAGADSAFIKSFSGFCAIQVRHMIDLQTLSDT